MKANKLINGLTINEDLRQDLWVAYLSGTPVTALYKKIPEILINYMIQEADSSALELIRANFPTDFFSSFSDIECRLLYLLYSGYNIGEISVTLSISRVVVSSMISSIKEKGEWSLLWPSRERLQIKRNSA